MTAAIRWQHADYDELTRDELYALLRLRQLVFVAEQNCPYLDADGEDQKASHLMGWRRTELVACARIFAPGAHYVEASIGRVVTRSDVRGEGIGRALMREALAHVRERFGEVAIRISAQRYLERFYGELGFVSVGEPYEEDGIAHIAMLRPRTTPS